MAADPSPKPNVCHDASRGVPWWAGVALVVGNMVGVGVFTSLGFQLEGIPSGFAALLLWVFGGAFALSGALCYAELAAAMPRSGGEYHLLGAVYHPAAGFLAGWVSLVAGFAAPVALAASLFGGYLAGSFGWGGEGKGLAALVIVGVTAAHVWKLPFGSGFQIVVTAIKFVIVAGLAVAGLAKAGGGTLSLAPQPGDWGLVMSAPFAISLFYVNYAYQGWNAATYIAGEIHQPAVGVPRALISGTVLVMALYLLVNAGFLLSTPAEAMAGQPEVGLIVAQHLFGQTGGAVVGTLIAFGLVSAISAMTWAGPRVAQSMGQDYAALGLLGRTNRHGVPAVAVVVQSAIALLMLFTASFKTIMLYLEFILNLSLAATVAGVFWLRWKRPDLARPYRCLGYPVSPAVFLSLAAYLEWRLLVERTAIALAGIATIVLGLLVYAIVWGRGSSGGSGRGRV